VHIAVPAKVGKHTTAGRPLANRSLLLFSCFVIISKTAMLGLILLLRLSRSARLILCRVYNVSVGRQRRNQRLACEHTSHNALIRQETRSIDSWTSNVAKAWRQARRFSVPVSPQSSTRAGLIVRARGTSHAWNNYGVFFVSYLLPIPLGSLMISRQ
jgi:hypothetical protein